jgi:hypothetical protein
VHLPEILGQARLTQDWLKMQPGGFSRWPAFRDFVVGFFSGRTEELWFDRPKANIAAIVFGAFALLVLLARLRLRAFTGRRLLPWLWFAAACLGPLVLDFAQGTYLIAKPRYAATALPAACLLLAAGAACLGPRMRLGIVTLLVLSWAPPLSSIFRNPMRSWSPVRQVAIAAAANTTADDLILVQSIPTGVIGVARYVNSPAPIASWIAQAGRRRVPESIERLIAGRASVRFVRIHDVGAPAPEETWLREHARSLGGTGAVNEPPEEFRPKEGGRF